MIVAEAMPDLLESVLKPWESFYVIVGGAAAALTGLVFVVITLISDDGRQTRSVEGVSAFSTPTVQHFGTSLFASMILSAPWPALIEPALLLSGAGAYGIALIVRALRKMQNLDYTADSEDLAWYGIVPLIANLALTTGAIALIARPTAGLFGIATGVTLLMFTGIRNAWDLVTYLAIGNKPQPNDPHPPQEPG